MEKVMIKPIELVYDFNIGGVWERRVYIAETYEDWHRIVRILHENEEHYRVVSVTRMSTERGEE